MKKLVIGTLALGLALSGCNSQLSADLSGAVTAVDADVAAAQATLKKLSTSVGSACSRIAVAEGYYNAVSFLVPPAAQSAESAAASVVASLCAAGTSTTLSAALPSLGQAWAVIQAATKKPGT